MVAQVQSFSHVSTTYSLTIDEEQGIATNCQCPDHQYRDRECKHMRRFNAAVQQAAMFILLQRQVREMHETARSNRELAFSQF